MNIITNLDAVYTEWWIAGGGGGNMTGLVHCLELLDHTQQQLVPRPFHLGDKMT